MNLPGEMQLPSRHGQDGFSAARSPRSVPTSLSRPPAPGAHPSPSLNMRRSPAMPPNPSSASMPTITRSFPSNPLIPIKSEPSTSQDFSLPDSGFSSAIPSMDSAPRSTVPDRAFAERSPSPQSRIPPAGAMADAVSAAKSPSLIRRLSRGAHNKIRRRASTTHSMRMRDQSAGPVLVRRRSDSNGAPDFGQDVSDLELDSTNEEVLEEFPVPIPSRDRLNGLGIQLGRSPVASVGNPSGIFEGGIAPATSAILENGTWLTKVTKRRMKRIKLWLHSSTARVCWHSSNPYKSFFIDDVREVRVGAESRNARDDAQVSDENEGRWVTIVYDVPDRSKGRNIKTMHVLMPDDYILKLWTDALNTVSRERIEIMNALASSPEKSERSMTMAWRQAMAHKGPGVAERFTLDDARWLCRQLEINCTDSAVRTHFKLISNKETASLDYEQYRSFVKTFKERKDLRQLYQSIGPGPEPDLDMDLDAFLDFLQTEQKVDVVKERVYWEGVFEKYARSSASRSVAPNGEVLSERRVLNMQSFHNFMTSSHTDPLVRYRGEANLSRPLNEYFISSSHNTYLLGRQVAGDSSVEGYIAALVKGCRCIEIDCWDGDDGRPMVTHGRTMTTKIPFEDTVSVVAKYAFNTTPYPLIVSLEVHCNPEQQLAMVDLMKKYFHSMLVTEPINPTATSLPSPEELKHKILIKVKASEDVDQPPPTVVDYTNGRSRARSIGSAFARTPAADTPSTVSSPMVSSLATSPSDQYSLWTSRGSNTSGVVGTPNSSADDSDEVPIVMDRAKKRKTSRIVHELGRLGVYTQGLKFGGFQSADAKTYNHVYSFGENTFDRLCIKNNSDKTLLEKHNMHHLMRVYPGPRRIDSSNFSPLSSWKRGVQMAALNWQTYDVHQQINEAMFAAGTDHSGYVLKPEELRHAKYIPITDTIGELSEKKEKKGKKLVKFTMEVISAQRLPRPRHQNSESGMNPYIEFEVLPPEDKLGGAALTATGADVCVRDGMTGIGSPLRKRTKIVEGNGFDPMFYQSINMAVETKHSALLFVRWTVWNSPDRKTANNSVLLATFTAKLDSLQQGYRHLPLFNPQGEQYRDAKLFVRIRKEEPIVISRSEDHLHRMPEPIASPRAEPVRGSWPRRIFGRQTSHRRQREPTHTELIAGPLSRTSSMDRESNP